jgi:hypothetical protein
MRERLQERTISDFDEQWLSFRDNDGYYGSVELFNDIFSPLLSAQLVAGKRVAHIVRAQVDSSTF